MRSRRSFVADAHRPRRRQTNHRHEIEAKITWAPASVYADDYVLPDWVAGAD
jgi:hypothetical protein